MKSFYVAPAILALLVSACGSGGGGGGGNDQPAGPDAFTSAVMSIAATELNDAEPQDIDNITVTTSDDAEPVTL